MFRLAAAKTICYLELPRRYWLILADADENGLTIFIFGRDEVYFEHIVIYLKSKSSEWNNLWLQERRISLSLKNKLGMKVWRALNQEILSNRIDACEIFYRFIRVDYGENI